ncbi:MAG: NAD(P)H-dependent oxidoreductase [Kordiimonadaceae bacterium]|nr:NAD(P)H-dependent oxidoreductase [Kordiimonadaceae bacterium]
MSKILLIFAHPSPNRSKINRQLYCVANKLNHVATRDLYELYPNLSIDVDAEHEAILRADVLVFLFPVFWFSAPSLLKEWMDTVLTNGFAYGDGGTALEGKKFMLAVSSGGSAESYTSVGLHGAEIETYLAPFYQTARYCKMDLTEPFISFGGRSLDADAIQQVISDFEARLCELGGVTDAS